MTLNIQDIETFFRFISTYDKPDTEIFTYCFLDKESKNVIQGHGVKFGTYEEIIWACKWQDQTLVHSVNPGFTLHTTLNSTKLSGRKTKDIEGVRVLCVDFDREVPKQSLKPLIESNRVQLVVESSPSKYHFYWKIDPAISLDLWHTYQLGLNQFFGGDLNMASVSHTIRVPGVSRVTKEGLEFMPSIVYISSDTTPLSIEKIGEQFPWIQNKAAEALEVQKKTRRIVSSTIKKFKNVDVFDSGKHSKVFDQILKEPDRNSALFSLVYGLSAEIEGGIESLEAAEILGANYNANLISGAHPKGSLGEDEIKKTVESAYERGIEAREKRKCRQAAKLARLLGDKYMELDAGGKIAKTLKYECVGNLVEKEETNGHGENGEEVIATNKNFEYDYGLGDLRDSPYTDLGLVERVIQRFGSHLIRTGKIVYAFDRKELVWRSQKGCPDIMQDYVCECCRDLIREPGFIRECTGDDGEVSVSKFTRMKNRFMSHTIVAQTISSVLSSPALQCRDIQVFDNNPYIFYCANGVINLESAAKGMAHNRNAVAEDYLIRRSGVYYDYAATCEYWEKFLLEVFASNDAPEQMVGFMQEVFGYALTGDVEEQALFLHSGEGSNGKSRVLYALGRLVGEYSTRLQSNTLTRSKNAIGKEIERIGAKIEAKRVVIIDDLDTKTQWNDGLVKCLTEKTIVSRRLYEEEKDIPNRAKFHIACNETPAVDGNSFAMFRRVSIIEYNRTFTPSAMKLKEIDAAIDRELSGILNWALKGLRRVLESGAINRPGEVLARIEEYTEANQGADILLNEMFGASLPEEEGYSIQDCVAHANRFAIQRGYLNVNFKPEALGRYFTKQGYKKHRVVKNRTKFTFRLVRLLHAENRTAIESL